jgi:4-amino-4-deoxy-L-arabinose transferase-like glycosyltransferase
MLNARLQSTSTRFLLLIWACFLARGFFYSSLFPLWEGYDEFSHFAYIQYLSNSQDLPIPQQSEVSTEIQDSVQLVPLPWELRGWPSPSLTHDAYWKLPPSARQARESQFAALSPQLAREPASGSAPLFWEAQQPPLYYFLLSGPLRLMSTIGLAGRVISMRYLSVAIASLVIPLGFLLARSVLADDQLALGVIALIAALPELLIETSRVGNDSLSIPLYTLLVLLTVKLLDESGKARYAWASGVALGCGLLTKEYFFTCLPVLTLAFAWMCWRAKEHRYQILFHGLLLGAIAAILSGWWIVRNYRYTGMWLWQPGEDPARKVPTLAVLRRAPEVDWHNVVHDVFTSHIWFGNWSFLHIRGWMYTVLWYGVMLVAVGLVVYARRAWRGSAMRDYSAVSQPIHAAVLIVFYGFFCIGLAYHAVLTFILFHASTSIGWYLYCTVVVEVLLVAIGLLTLFQKAGRQWVLPTITALFALLELYATHFLLIPYYSGLIAHSPDGALATFHVRMLKSVGFFSVVKRLVVNKPSSLNTPVFLLQWVLFVGATVGLVFISTYVTLRSRRARQAPLVGSPSGA